MLHEEFNYCVTISSLGPEEGGCSFWAEGFHRTDSGEVVGVP